MVIAERLWRLGEALGRGTGPKTMGTEDVSIFNRQFLLKRNLILINL